MAPTSVGSRMMDRPLSIECLWADRPRYQMAVAGRYGSSTPSMVMVWPMQAASPNSRARRRTVEAGTVVTDSTYSGV